MCGLFGFAGQFTLRAGLVLQALAIADEVRGRHSTGFAGAYVPSGSRRLKACMVKRALTGTEFVRRGHTRLLFEHAYRLVIGHNRYATAGAVTRRNAHPFPVPTPAGLSFGAHNGMVGGKSELALRFGVRDYPVDSEVMLRAIAKGAGKTEADLLHSIARVASAMGDRADYACLWLDLSKRAIYCWRTPERPLVVVDARKVGLGRWFASTVEIFSAAWTSVQGILPSIRKLSYFEIRPYYVYRVVDDGEWEVERVWKLPEPSRGGATQVVPVDEGESDEVEDLDPAFDAPIPTELPAAKQRELFKEAS